MKTVYMILFFLDMLAMTWIAYHLFQGMDDGSGMERQAVLGTGLLVTILLLLFFIRRYIGRPAGPRDKMQ
jgi:hypothetical protein